mmetsp:Transcript_19340/g.28597  ORF Transcript_19340/g.28597 Transcript_19340/m.28597 type:complete len:208 (-) Transcript_19340:728-1351(-)
MDRAVSTAPPPATKTLPSNILFTTISESCKDLSISSSMNSLAPLRITVQLACVFVPFTNISSPSPTLSSLTSSASPKFPTSNDSLPSMSAKVLTIFAPVALAILLMSSIFTLRTAIAFASTKYFKHKSSIPFVVRTTFAPEIKIFSILSFVMSISLCRMESTSFISFTTTSTPMCILCLCRLKSNNAILAFLTLVGIPCDPLEQFNA